jgi:hypothetical protein
MTIKNNLIKFNNIQDELLNNKKELNDIETYKVKIKELKSNIQLINNNKKSISDDYNNKIEFLQSIN